MTTCWTLLPDIESSLLSTHLQLTTTQQRLVIIRRLMTLSTATIVRCLDSSHSIPCCSACNLPLRAGLQYLTVTLSWWVSALWCRAREHSHGHSWGLQSLHTLFHHSQLQPCSSFLHDLSSFSCPTFAHVLTKFTLTNPLSSPIAGQILISTLE